MRGIVSDGVFFQAPSSECLNEEIECSLLDVLEPLPNISEKYFLSRKSILGHYRRIVRAGRQKSIRPSIWKAFCFHAMIAEMEQS